MSAIELQYPLILASGSPQRKLLLEEAGYRFTVIVPPLEEPDDILAKLLPSQQAEALSFFKARCVADMHPNCLVLGADTIVALGGEVMGKPADADDARRMLRALSGKRQAVITGVTLLGPGGERLIASDVTNVTMRPISPTEIEDYIASGEWMGKAGAYAIQETADRFVQKLEGSFSNVVGLPMEMIEKMLGELMARPEKHRVS